MMTASVRWVFQRQGGQDGAQKPCLCFEGERWALCVASGDPVRVLKRKLDDVRRCRAVRVAHDSADAYPPVRAAQRLLELGEEHGITDAARRLLELLIKAKDSTAISFAGEDTVEDEESLAMTGHESPQAETGNDDTTNDDTTNDGTTTDGDKEMTTKSKTTKGKPAGTTAKVAKGKPAVKAKAPAKAPAKTASGEKAPAKEKAPRPTHARLPKTKGDGPTPFRVGTAKEKAFLLYKDHAGKYAEMSKEQKGEWADKQAGKLGISPGTLRSWISGQFTVALKA